VGEQRADDLRQGLATATILVTKLDPFGISADNLAALVFCATFDCLKVMRAAIYGPPKQHALAVERAKVDHPGSSGEVLGMFWGMLRIINLKSKHPQRLGLSHFVISINGRRLLFVSLG